jgi:hypothetical protein
MGSDLSKQNIDILIEKLIVSDMKGQSAEKAICIYYKNIGAI